jgi:ABC-type sulfate/molybdate transport systems ATPase subunit
MSSPGTLSVAVSVPGRLEARIEVTAGETVAVLGANGAGKSTLLSVIAGLHHLERGQGAVTLDGHDLTGLPPHRRGVALLAQDPLLFPHLSAEANVAFGPRSHGVRRRAAHATALELLRQVGVADLARRRPHQISGGQAQRVAIARALATDPRVLLLDEPMAALDVDVKPALRQTLRTVLADRTTLLVTHDVLDALLLADRVIVLAQGEIVEEGRTQDVLSRPRSAFAARLAGLDLLTGIWDGAAVQTALGPIHGLPDRDSPLGLDEPATALFRPAAVSIYATAPAGSPRNRISVTVADLEPLGDRVRVRGMARGEGGDVPLTAEVTPGAVADLGLVPGLDVTFSVKATEVSVYGTFKPGVTPSGPDTVAL